MSDAPTWWRDRAGRHGRCPVEGGIKARSSAAQIGAAPGGRRGSSTVLESLGVGGRLDRGRSYARAGQVLCLDVSTPGR